MVWCGRKVFVMIGNARNGDFCVYLAGVADDVVDEQHEERVHPYKVMTRRAFCHSLGDVMECGSSHAKDL